MIYNSALELIGNTPIIRLNNIDSNIYLKLEKFNIGGSIKDRAVLGMIEDKMKNKEINVGDTIVEATSGNTGIALSMIGRLKQLNVIIIMPESMTKERIDLMNEQEEELDDIFTNKLRKINLIGEDFAAYQSLNDGDKKALKKLNINLTCESEFISETEIEH